MIFVVFVADAITIVVAVVGIRCAIVISKQGKVIGGACVTSSGSSGSCADGSERIVDSDFPDGSCAKDRTAQADCPDGAACIQENGGICILERADASDCRDGYNCVAKSALNPAGSAKVCLLE